MLRFNSRTSMLSLSRGLPTRWVLVGEGLLKVFEDVINQRKLFELQFCTTPSPDGTTLGNPWVFFCS